MALIDPENPSFIKDEKLIQLPEAAKDSRVIAADAGRGPTIMFETIMVLFLWQGRTVRSTETPRGGISRLSVLSAVSVLSAF